MDSFNEPPTLVQQLARWVHDYEVQGLSPAVLDKAKLHLLDAIACAFAAYHEEAGHAALDTVRALGGVPECTLIGAPDRTSLTNAVLANGILVRALDLNDFDNSKGGAGHPSDNISVSLAVAERLGSSGRDLLAAIALGYEIYCRTPVAEGGRGMFDGSTKSGLVAAAMSGWLMGLPEDRLADALSLAICHCNTLSCVRGGSLSAAKNIANSMIAHTAVTATLLAAQGLTGPPIALEHWKDSVLGGADLSPLLEPPEGYILKVGFKAHPSVGTSQAAVEAAIRAHHAVGGGWAEVDRIEVHMADIPFVRGQIENRHWKEPTSRELADHSFHFLIAVAFHDGELTLRQFEHERWTQPAMRALMAKVDLVPDAALNRYLPGFPCTIRVQAGPREHVVEMPYAPGHQMNPMGFDGVAAKFHRFASGRVPQQQRDEIVETVGRLHEVGSVRDLTQALAVK